jgi:hypothetical protein
VLDCCLQEDLTVKDINEIIDDLKAGKKPKAGPRYVWKKVVVCIISLFHMFVHFVHV